MNGMRSLSCDRFHKPFLIFTTVCSFLCTIHYFLCIFSKNGYLFIGYRYCVLKKRTKKREQTYFLNVPYWRNCKGFQKGEYEGLAIMKAKLWKYIVSNFRMEDWAVFWNGVVWCMKTAHDLKPEEFFNSFNMLFVMFYYKWAVI